VVLKRGIMRAAAGNLLAVVLQSTCGLAVGILFDLLAGTTRLRGCDAREPADHFPS
jgi:hypothetical protein